MLESIQPHQRVGAFGCERGQGRRRENHLGVCAEIRRIGLAPVIGLFERRNFFASRVEPWSLKCFIPVVWDEAFFVSENQIVYFL